MRLTIAVLLLLCKCLIFELVTTELSFTVMDEYDQPTCPLKICSDVLKDLGVSEARFKALETQIEEIKKESRGRPRVAFSAKLGSNGFFGPVITDTTLVYKNVFINVGEAYNRATGIFTAPVRGVYYFSFFYHCGTAHGTRLALTRNGKQVAVTAHHSHSPGSAENGGSGVTLLLEKGDKVYIVLQKDTWVWDGDSDSVTVFSGFLINTM